MPGLKELTVDLTPLRVSRDFRLLWTGQTVSAVGSMLTRVAVPLQVWDLTHSYFKLGLTGLISLAPTLICAIAGGALADIVDRRRMILGSLLMGTILSLLLALNASVGTPRLWALYVLAALSGANMALSSPSSRSSVRTLVPSELLASAMAVQMLTYTFSGMLGPVLGGFLVRTIGAPWTYAIDAASFGACFLAVTRISPIPKANVGERFRPSLVMDGFRALKGRHAVQGSFAADLIAMIFGMPTALFPAVADERFIGHSALVGLLYAAVPFGMFVASVLSGWTRRVHRHGMVVVLSVVVWGIAITLFGFVNGIMASLFFLAIAGAADMISGVSRQAMLQLATPAHLQGRMQGVGMAVWIGGPYIGDFEAGGVAAITSADVSIVIGGVACIVGIGALAAALPAFTKFDSSEHSEPAPADEPEVFEGTLAPSAEAASP